MNKYIFIVFISLLFCAKPFAQADFFGGGQGGVLTYSLNGASDVNSWNWDTTLTDVRTLVLKGGYTHTWKGGNGNVCNGKIYYRVYRQDQTPGSFLGPIILGFPSNNGFTTTATPSNISGNNSGDQLWVNTSQNINIAAFANTPGTWVLEVYFQADGSTSNSSDCTTDALTDNNGGQNYKIFFDRMINPGFESQPSTNGWVLQVDSGQPTWSWGSTTNRSGGKRLDASTTTTYNRNAAHSSYSVSVPASGTNYIHVIGYYRRTAGSVRVEARGTTSINGSLESGTIGQWNRATASGEATNGGIYHPRFSFQGSSSANYAFDDIIIYTSPSAGVDLTKPNSPSNLLVSRVGNDNIVTWTDGADAATNSSGIEGTLILRVAGDKTASLAALQTRILDQAYYSTNPSIGPNTISDGTNTWTVLSNAFFSGTFTDTNALSDATYVVVMRDRAFNYSDPVAFYCLDCIPCAGTPNPGNTLVASTTPCFGDSLTLSLQNPTSGNIITYQWQSADDAAFTSNLTNLGNVSTQAITANSAKFYRCLVTCSVSNATGISNFIYITPKACYCTSGATNTGHGRIQRVQFNSIDNISASSCPAYSDFTNISTIVTPSTSYTISVTLGTCSTNHNHRISGWIDWNGNGIFGDQPNEVIPFTDIAYLPGNTATATIVVPANFSGCTRMRIIAREGSTQVGPCGTYGFAGETEDYTVQSNTSALLYNVTGGGNYCNGGPGVTVGLDGSQVGVSYQVVFNGQNVGAPVVGTGSSLTLGTFLTGGTYTVFATGTGFCPLQMNGSATVIVDDCSSNTFNAFASAVLFANCLSDTNFYNTSGDVVNQIGTVALQNQNLGTFFQNSEDFILRGGELKTFKSNTSSVCTPLLYYRVYPASDLNPLNSFVPININFLENCNCSGCPGSFPSGGPCNGVFSLNDQKWQTNNAGVNLTNFSPGSYIIEVYFQIPGNENNTSGCPDTKFVNNGGNNFKANFTIIPPTSTITQNP